MRYDYTFLCECGWESTPMASKKECWKDAREHALTDPRCGIKNPTIFVDQYDHEMSGGEMSGRWEKKTIATPAKK